MRKTISLMLTVVILLTALPAMADNVKTSGDFEYTIKGNGTATIVGYTGDDNNDIILPSMVDGYTVTTIGESAFAIDRGEYNSFIDVSVSVTLPDTITAIESKAFENRPLSSINIPDCVEYIGYGAFIGSNKIQFRISNNQPYFAAIKGSLYNKKDKELLKWVDDSEVVPEGILSIGDYAFAGMGSPRYSKEVLPQSLTRIGNYAFWNTSDDYDMHFLVIPPAVAEIGSYAFADAGDIHIQFSPSSQLEIISEGAFGCIETQDGNCYSQHVSIKFPDSLEYIKTIGKFAFYDSGIWEWNNQLLMNLEKIEPYAFFSLYYKIDGVKIPGTCKIVGEGAFYQSWLGEVTIGHGVERIESKAFYYGSEPLENVYLPDSLTYIASDAFSKETTYIVEKGSYAERWAKENAFSYTINGEEQNLDWLNN